MSSNHRSSAIEFAISDSRNFISRRAAAPIFRGPMLLLIWPRHRISRRQAKQEALFQSIKWGHERTKQTETHSQLQFSRGKAAFIINGVSCCSRLASDARRARKRSRAVSSESISFTSSYSLYLYPSIPVLLSDAAQGCCCCWEHTVWVHAYTYEYLCTVNKEKPLNEDAR